MSKQSELALVLNGREYREETTAADIKFAKDNNLVIFYGASDDLLIMEGALGTDEFGAYNGTSLEYYKEYFSETHEIERYCASYYIRINRTAYFDGCWSFDTNIPKTAKFIIREGNEIYGEGIVVNLGELK